MARVLLRCPLDGTNLGAANLEVPVTVLGNVAADAGVHLHLTFSFQLTCANGHTWRSVGELTLFRE